MTKFSVLQMTEDDKGLWNEFVANTPNAYVYDLWEWGDVLCRTYNYERYYLAVKRGKDVMGIMPLIYIKSSVFANKLVSLPFCEYGGPLVNSTDKSVIKLTLKMLFRGLNELARKLIVDYIELRQPPSFLSSFFPSFGFTVLQRYLTFKVNLTKNESELWRNLKKNTRYHVRKAIKAGIEIKDVDANHVEQYYSLYLKTQRRHGSPPHSYSFFKNIFNSFKPKGLLQMIVAVHNDKPIAGEINFLFNGIIYGWGSVTDRNYAHLNPTSLLWWYMIKSGLENDYKILDLGRTRLEAEGIYHFKSGWGSVKVRLQDYVFYMKDVGVPDPFQRKYVLLSKIWSLMPQALTQRVGPKIISKIGL